MTVSLRRTGPFSCEVSFTTRAPQQIVYDYLSNFQNHTDWSKGLIQMTQTSPGEPVVGTTYRTDESAAGSKDVTLCEITALERPRLIGWKAQTEKQRWPMGVKAEWAFEIEPAESESRVTQRMELIPASRLFVRAFFLVADLLGGTGATPKAVRKNAARLEARLDEIS